MSKTEVSQGQVHVTVKPPHVMGDWTGVYRKAENAAPTMMLVKKMNKSNGSTSGIPYGAMTGPSPVHLMENRTPDIKAKNSVAVMHLYHRRCCRIHWRWGTVKGHRERLCWRQRTSVTAVSDFTKNVMKETPVA